MLDNYGGGPLGPAASLTRPDDPADPYGQQTWFKGPSGPGKKDGTVLEPAFLNRIIAERLVLSERSGVPLGANQRNDSFLADAVLGILRNNVPATIIALGAMSIIKALDDHFRNEDWRRLPTPAETLSRVDAAVGSTAWRSQLAPENIVGSLNTYFGSTAWQNLGALTGYMGLPQGRLTLTSGVPVLTSTVAAAGTVYYTPYLGEQVPIWDGSRFIAWTFPEMSNVLANSATGKAGPAAATTNSNYDLFVWNDAGTLRLTRGPAWSSDTTRGVGDSTAELQAVDGRRVNAVDISNGPNAGYGTYVGTIRTNSSSKVDWIYGTVAAGGGAAIFGLWNAYNRVDVRTMIGDSTDTWTLASTSTRPANNSTSMRASFICGLEEDAATARYMCSHANDTNGGQIAVGVALSDTSGFDGSIGWIAWSTGSANDVRQSSGEYGATVLGWGYFQAMEAVRGAGTGTFRGDASVPSACQNGLHFNFRA